MGSLRSCNRYSRSFNDYKRSSTLCYSRPRSFKCLNQSLRAVVTVCSYDHLKIAKYFVQNTIE